MHQRGVKRRHALVMQSDGKTSGFRLTSSPGMCAFVAPISCASRKRPVNLSLLPLISKLIKWKMRYEPRRCRVQPLFSRSARTPFLRKPFFRGDHSTMTDRLCRLPKSKKKNEKWKVFEGTVHRKYKELYFLGVIYICLVYFSTKARDSQSCIYLYVQ